MEWKKYKFTDIEEKLIDGQYDAFDTCDYNISHLLYMLWKKSSLRDEGDVKWVQYLKKIISEEDLSKSDKLNELFSKIGYFIESLNSNIKEELYKIIAINSNWKKLENNPYTTRYNEYIDNHNTV